MASVDLLPGPRYTRGSGQVLHPHPSVSLWGTFPVGTGERGGETGWNFFFGKCTAAWHFTCFLASRVERPGQGPGRGQPRASSCPRWAHSPKGRCCLLGAWSTWGRRARLVLTQSSFSTPLLSGFLIITKSSLMPTMKLAPPQRTSSHQQGIWEGRVG